MASLRQRWSLALRAVRCTLARLRRPTPSWLRSALGTLLAPPALESTMASTVEEIFQLENHHLALVTNAEHLKKNTHCYCPESPDNTESSLSGKLPTLAKNCQILFSVTP